MATKNGRVNTEALVKQALGTAKQSKARLKPRIDDIEEAFPMLHAFMTCSEVDGKTRQLPTITVWAEDGSGCKAVLNDRQSKLKLFAESNSLMGLIGELDAALSGKEPDWRTNQGVKPKRRS